MSHFLPFLPFLRMKAAGGHPAESAKGTSFYSHGASLCRERHTRTPRSIPFKTSSAWSTCAITIVAIASHKQCISSNGCADDATTCCDLPGRLLGLSTFTQCAPLFHEIPPPNHHDVRGPPQDLFIPRCREKGLRADVFVRLVLL